MRIKCDESTTYSHQAARRYVRPRMIKRTAVVNAAPLGQASREKFGLLVACSWSSFAEGAKRAPSPDLLPELRRRFAVLRTVLRSGVRSRRRAARPGLALASSGETVINARDDQTPRFVHPQGKR